MIEAQFPSDHIGMNQSIDGDDVSVRLVNKSLWRPCSGEK